MLDYAWRVMTTRRSLWIPTAGCALIAALPGSIVAIYLMAPLTALLLTGNAALALDLAPVPLDRPVVTIVVALLVTTLGLAIWSRLYAAAVWASDDRKDANVAEAFRGSRSRWRSVFLLYTGTYAIIAGGLGLTVALLGFVGNAPIALVVALMAGAALLAVRAVLRIALTLAVRVTVLDGESAARAWARGFVTLKSKSRAALAVWIALLATGAVVWIGGRLISPVLQDTALDYPRSSALVAYREIAQLALAVPLETFLLTLSLGVWTALYTGRGEGAERLAPSPSGSGGSGRTTSPWVIRALILLVGLTLLSNGIPTLVDRSWAQRQARAEAAVESREIDPEDAVRSPGPDSGAGRRTKYNVVASLEEDELRWTTRIHYVNNTGEELRDLGIHIYPAAYTRSPEQIPFGRDLGTSDFSGAFRSQVRPGTLEVERLTLDGDAARHTRDLTDMLIELTDPLKPGEQVDVRLELLSKLPAFPERFGVWDDMTLLGNWIPVIALRDLGTWRMDGFPSIGDPFAASVADYRVVIEADERLSIAGSGVLASVAQADPDTKTWTFVANASRDAAFVVAPFLRGLQGVAEGTTVRSWYSAEDLARGKTNLRAAISAVRHYTKRYGPLPFDEVDIVATKGLLGGMEYPGVVFAGDTSRSLAGTPVLPELIRHAGLQEAQDRYLIGHEVAHQWWYASVGSDQVREPWLDEAFAEVAVRLWLRAVDGDDRAWQMTRLMPSASPRPGVVGAGIQDFSSNEAYSDAVYVAGAEVLMELRARVGAKKFDVILREWHARKQLRTGTIDDFIEIVEDVADKSAADTISRYR